MMKDGDKSNIVPMATPAADAAHLAYTVELWDLLRTGPERVIGRAASVGLARAIFSAARREHLGRRILLRRGGQVLAQSE